MNTITRVERFRSMKRIVVRGRDVHGATVTLRLEWAEAAKLAALLLAMLYGTLIAWRTPMLDEGEEREHELHEWEGDGGVL